MSEAELQEAVRDAIKKTDADADDLRAVANWLQSTAAKWDVLDA